MATPSARRSIVVDKQSRGPDPAPDARPVTWEVDRFLCKGKTRGLVHAAARLGGSDSHQTCCRERYAGVTHALESAVVNCIYCLLCRGCIACKDGMVTKETMRRGRWLTKNRRELFPCEMDDLHLCNSIRALEREGDRYKENWEDWLVVLKAEAKLRDLSWQKDL